jgi:alkylation response protein AidB-like acyl-CoA dehydrogenase
MQNDRTLGSYVSRGGVARGSELVSLIRTRADQPISRIARWIVSRQAVQFKSGPETVFPLFQFDLAEMSIRSDVRRVLAELADAFDDFEVAQWFVQPNACLAGATPVDALPYDVDGVLAAARTDRFVVLG